MDFARKELELHTLWAWSARIEMLATAEKGAGPCSTAQQGEHDSHVHQSPAPASLFIIHESSSSSIWPNGGSASPPKLRRRRNKSRSPGASRAHHISSGPRQKKSTLRSSAYTSDPTSCKTSSHASATVRAVSPSVIPVLNEGQEGKEEEQQQNEPETTSAQVTAKNNRAMELSILNRCGTAPDLPMYSPLSASVYSSSKKRSMQSNNNGSSPHLATIQRSRLTPLPNNVCAPVVKPDPFLDNLDEMDTRQSTLAVSEDLSIVSLKAKDPLLQEKMRHDAQTIASLKQRLMALEREVSASTKYRHMTEKQIAQLSLENQRLQTEKIQQQSRIDELDKTVLRQRHEYDKLAARYASVYANLQKLVDQQQNASDKSAQQSALQALARENQDFLPRHVEDKTLTFNQEKKIKRLKAEIEALQHMHDAKNRDGDYEESASDTDQVSSLNKSKKRTDGEANHVGRPGSASSSVSITSSTPRRAGSSARVQVAQASPVGTASHLVTAEAYQYIDPNILKVLEKVDSQFSITNAINLSVVLKKWLNSCVHTVCSTHLPTVLQT
ncbi:unnamed protein product [Phytophthora lilii]|uniref:Unnamed protein product n=1 Tax=Phytophthora lilii TaxID=2077276 RepID=A0A9W6X8J1_9STRA|nr:unnamed protein product [Phytophthora lilii]